MIKTEYCLITLTEKAYTLRRTLFIVAWDTIKTLLFSTLESGQTIKFNHHNSVRHCSGIPEKSPTQEACNSAWLLWCLLTQEAYPEASSTPRPPSCKCPTSCRNTRCSPAVRAPSASSSGRSASSSALVQQIRKCRDSKLSVRYNRCGKVSFRSSNWSICTLRMNPAQCGWLRQTVLYYWPPNAQDLQSSSFSVIWVFSPISIPKEL